LGTNVDLQEIIKDYGLGRKESEFGTDKDSPHSYISNFYQPLVDLIDTPKCLLEVGVWKGASCALWKIAFPQCSVLGIDIKIKELHPVAIKLMETNQIQLIQSDAYSHSFTNSLKNKFDLIIDDGPHTIESQIKALNYFIPLLAEGGTLVIEDIQNGIVDMKKLWRSLPSHLRGNSCYLSFRSNSRRHDDAVFVYSLSPSVLCLAANLKKEYMYWGFKAPILHYAYEMAVEMRLLAKRVSRLPKKLNSLLS
jgi:hypothetical protein